MAAAQDRKQPRDPANLKVCIVGASGKLGQYMVRHALDRGYEVVGVCRQASVDKLDAFKGRITVIAGATDDREVIKRAVAGCDGVLTVLVPRGVNKLLIGNGPGGARPRPAGGTPGVLVRVAHHQGWSGRVLVEAQSDREGRRPTGAGDSWLPDALGARARRRYPGHTVIDPTGRSSARADPCAATASR